MPNERITAENCADVAAEYDVRFIRRALTCDNYKDVLRPLLCDGDFLLNLSVDVSSVALIALAREVGALYLDACIEPWVGGYTDLSLSSSQRSNYALRERALALRCPPVAGPTAVLTHGADPGLVSHFVKEALPTTARDTGTKRSAPRTREGWPALTEGLGVKAIHIAERDTQTADIAKRHGEFVNTWSVDGFVGEGCQPAELGWGAHEKALPPDARRHADEPGRIRRAGRCRFLTGVGSGSRRALRPPRDWREEISSTCTPCESS